MVGLVWKVWFLFGYVVIGIFGIYLVNWCVNWFGKCIMLVVIFVLVFIGLIGKWMFFMFGGNLWKIMFDLLFCGLVWIVINVLMLLMFVDICDDDEFCYG